MQDLGISILFNVNNISRLLEGLLVTIEISLLSAIFSVIFGLIFGLFMRIDFWLCKLLSRLYLEFVRVMPQLVLLFIMYFGVSSALGADISAFASSVIVFSFWGAAEMGDLVRSALNSVPLHQYNSAYALGLSKAQTYRYVIIPQTLRALAPLTINLITRIIKTTSLVALIGVVEVLKVAEQIIDSSRFSHPSGALWVYSFVFLLYFLLCFVISLSSKFIEERLKC